MWYVTHLRNRVLLKYRPFLWFLEPPLLPLPLPEYMRQFVSVRFRGEICQCRHCRRQCKIFASGVNFSGNNLIYNINESKKYILSWFSSLKLKHITNQHIYNQKMPKWLIIDAFTLLVCGKNVANHALLRCKTCSLKIWLCKIFDKYHVWSGSGHNFWLVALATWNKLHFKSPFQEHPTCPPFLSPGTWYTTQTWQVGYPRKGLSKCLIE